jgi:hypothetical protein
VLCNSEIAAELALENAVYPAGTLFGAQLAGIVRFTLAAALIALAMLARGKAAFFERALGGEAALTLQEKFFTFTPA